MKVESIAECSPWSRPTVSGLFNVFSERFFENVDLIFLKMGKIASVDQDEKCHIMQTLTCDPSKYTMDHPMLLYPLLNRYFGKTKCHTMQGLHCLPR